MLLAIDVGNTETVIGLFTRLGEPVAAQDGGVAASGSSEATRGLTHHWRLSTAHGGSARDRYLLFSHRGHRFTS